MRTYVELFAFAFDRDAVHYGKQTADLSASGMNPDSAVYFLLNGLEFLKPVEETVSLVHSTSWRFEDDGTIALSYLAYCRLLMPDRRLPHTLGFHDLAGCRQDDPLRPRPAAIHERDVLSHGLRHLSFLVCEDGDARYADMLGEDACRTFSIFQPQTAGQLIY
ncbi:MAG: hypothetical protein FD164_1861 [Nitrospirae bacterium]|nr:MAG: hypothetical protein FD164_1861 [Nitrospirota bacterium]